MACLALVVFLFSAGLLLQLPATHALTHKKIPTFTAYNLLSRQGDNSTQGYNTVRCGHAATVQPNAFGDIYCFDMPLLKEQDLASEVLGSVQGSYVFSQLEGGRVFVTETFIVNATSLKYTGSFSALGIENIGKLSSKPITGGTDDYELVSGNAFTTPLDTGNTDEFGNLVFWFKYKFVFAH